MGWHNTMKIFIIGDSISAHYTPFLQTCLPEGVEATRGEKGGDSSMVVSFLKEKWGAGGIDADLLLLNCGLHDIKTDPMTGAKQVPMEQYRENLQAIIQLTRQMKPKLVWVRTTPCDEGVHNRPDSKFHRFAADCHAYNAAADEIMAEERVPMIDLYNFTRRLGPDLYCDHVHFPDHIREKQAAFLAGWVMCWMAVSGK
ncbi:MAG: hypothetical protein COZ05_02700 [Armatimonadetes bacterium CG_4_10_14_3_um_filter_59_10]|nr:MAG: hypothetical protein COZ05_02700 [Armatimonadetes bacterium CG_4_10_14_3_um_filter_59_10]